MSDALKRYIFRNQTIIPKVPRFMISVLLIDDDPELLEIIRLVLGYESDFTIQACNSPACAIELTQEQGFDSIVCDYYMPAMDGCSLLQLLRFRGCTAQFIMYSGKDPDDEMTHTLTRKGDVYLQRQGNPEAEFTQLKRIIRTAYTSRNGPALPLNPPLSRRT
jgi:CheY-like chemotaxis protein